MNFSAHLFFLECQSQCQREINHWLLGKIIFGTEKKREPLLESKLQALSEKIFSLQGTVSLLNMCIGEENQSPLKTDK